MLTDNSRLLSSEGKSCDGRSTRLWGCQRSGELGMKEAVKEGDCGVSATQRGEEGCGGSRL